MGGGIEVEWILYQLDRPFLIVPVRSAAYGLVVARLVPRGP